MVLMSTSNKNYLTQKLKFENYFIKDKKERKNIKIEKNKDKIDKPKCTKKSKGNTI